MGETATAARSSCPMLCFALPRYYLELQALQGDACATEFIGVVWLIASVAGGAFSRQAADI